MLVTGKNAGAVATFKNKGGREKETLDDAAKNKENVDVVATCPTDTSMLPPQPTSSMTKTHDGCQKETN